MNLDPSTISIIAMIAAVASAVVAILDYLKTHSSANKNRITNSKSKAKIDPIRKEVNIEPQVTNVKSKKVVENATKPPRSTFRKGLTSFISWILVLWITYIFLGSLPYKFTDHPDSAHIFGTIGQWIGNFIGEPIGRIFIDYGATLVGTYELLTSLVLLSPFFLWIVKLLRISRRAVDRRKWHAIGGFMSMVVMSGATFFHLFTPLGVEVQHNGQTDGGALFYAAVSITIGGFVLWLINRNSDQLKQ